MYVNIIFENAHKIFDIDINLCYSFTYTVFYLIAILLQFSRPECLSKENDL